eukprot:303965-Chlamydomonas_euryale.AAC.2
MDCDAATHARTHVLPGGTGCRAGGNACMHMRMGGQVAVQVVMHARTCAWDGQVAVQAVMHGTDRLPCMGGTGCHAGGNACMHTCMCARDTVCAWAHGSIN